MRIHTCLSIRGILRTYTKKDWKLFGKYCCVGNDGAKATADQAKDSILDLLSKGVEYLPIGDPCEGFSYKTGCPGHKTAIDRGES